MKTAARLLLTLALPGLIGCAGVRPSAGPETAPPPAKRLTALEILRQREPDTKWEADSLVKADLDQDGTEDYAFKGIRGDLVIVGIVNGPVEESCSHWTLEFPWDGGQDSLCTREARIEFETIQEQGEPSRPGINLHDDLCDAFHIFWDPEQKTYDWWRL
ncbi:MAG TPA: hypothetical protein VFR31_18300 [Thermoanaerobaculia bacterium]|nr:hypothetical protein [Thermoanaerobaculia bacterium]